MNVALLEDIKAHILAEPQSFRMDTWTCGTAHCIAGWALKLSGLTILNPKDGATAQKLEDGRWPDDAAAALLGVEASREGWEPKSGDRLFLTDFWPEDLEERYSATYSRAERAQIAAERINRFVASGGAE